MNNINAKKLRELTDAELKTKLEECKKEYASLLTAKVTGAGAAKGSRRSGPPDSRAAA